jgi:hypothetical protein
MGLIEIKKMTNLTLGANTKYLGVKKEKEKRKKEKERKRKKRLGAFLEKQGRKGQNWV